MAKASDCVPSPLAALDPLRTTWNAGRRLYRVHSKDFGAAAFNPGLGRGGRFHPFVDGKGDSVPTLYAADQIGGALSETVFHDRVAGGIVLGAELADRYITEIELTEELVLANLTGHGLRRLGLTRPQLLECSSAQYVNTVRWAAALHRSADDIAGLVWVSRQYDTAKSIVVFGDRVSGDPFAIRGESRPLYKGSGYRLVQKAASDAGIAIIEG